MEKWRKSSHSDANGGQCVEVALTGTGVTVRDTTNRGGPTLSVPASAWRAFAADLKRALASRQAQHQGGTIGQGVPPFAIPSASACPKGVPDAGDRQISLTTAGSSS